MGAIYPRFRQILSPQRFLLRGECAVAPTGVAFVVVLLATIGATVWWSSRIQGGILTNRRFQQMRATGELLRQSAEAMFVADDLSAVRRLVVETARHANLTDCRIELLDGRVLADADPAKITARRVEAKWPGGKTPAEEELIVDGAIRLVYDLYVPAMGHARLVVSAPKPGPASAGWRSQVGMGLIAVVALAGLLLVYRHARLRLRALGEIREALLALSDGEQSSKALQLSHSLGSEADAWNRLLSENQQVKQQRLAEKAHKSLGEDRRSSGGLEAACSAMSQGLVLVDKRQQITYANGAAANFLEIQRDQLVGTPIDRTIADRKILELFQSAASGVSKRRGAVEVDRQHEDGVNRGVLRFTVRPVSGAGNHTTMILIDDITQQRMAEDSQHAFVAQATHELRTPLTNICLSAEAVIDAGDEDPAIRAKYLNVINQEARRLERIVAEMLSVAAIEAGAIVLVKDDVPLTTMFEQLKDDYQPQAEEKNITLRFELPPKIPHFQGDRDKIMVAMHNLVGNALKYTPQGKQVSVIVEAGEKELAIRVSDTGIGIRDQDLERIFEKFYRAKDKRVHRITGSGLGLALAREVIRLHGGEITVESELDQGSIFTLTLPVQSQAA